jgi:hypothetical protein
MTAEAAGEEAARAMLAVIFRVMREEASRAQGIRYRHLGRPFQVGNWIDAFFDAWTPEPADRGPQRPPDAPLRRQSP